MFDNKELIVNPDLWHTFCNSLVIDKVAREEKNKRIKKNGATNDYQSKKL